MAQDVEAVQTRRPGCADYDIEHLPAQRTYGSNFVRSADNTMALRREMLDIGGKQLAPVFNDQYTEIRSSSIPSHHALPGMMLRSGLLRDLRSWKRLGSRPDLSIRRHPEVSIYGSGFWSGTPLMFLLPQPSEPWLQKWSAPLRRCITLARNDSLRHHPFTGVEDGTQVPVTQRRTVKLIRNKKV